LTVRFGGIAAVERASFDARRGVVCALIGPNTAGKSTLFNGVSHLYEFHTTDASTSTAARSTGRHAAIWRQSASAVRSGSGALSTHVRARARSGGMPSPRRRLCAQRPFTDAGNARAREASVQPCSVHMLQQSRARKRPPNSHGVGDTSVVQLVRTQMKLVERVGRVVGWIARRRLRVDDHHQARLARPVGLEGVDVGQVELRM